MNDLHKYFNAQPLTFCAQRRLDGGGPVKDNGNDKLQRFPYKMGVELELENCRGIPDGGIGGWTTHNDESLRNGIEWVTSPPCGGKMMSTAIDNFYAAGMRYQGGPRTSTHIHVNMSQNTVEQLRVMFILSYVVEDAMFKVLNAKRKFCGYCMPLTEMPHHRIRNFLGATQPMNFVQSMGGANAEKYYGFNINSMRKHGTVEFRYFPGAPSKDDLLSWMDYCTQLKTVGLNTTIENLLDFSSAEPFAAWLVKAFPLMGPRFVAEVGSESLYGHLQDVLAMLPADTPERLETIIFVNEPLLKLVNRFELKDEYQFNHFANQVRALRIMSYGDWQQQIHSAMRVMPPAQKPQVKMEDEVIDAAPRGEWGGNLPDWAVNPVRPRAAAAPPDMNRVQARYEELMRQQAARDEALARAADILRYDPVPEAPAEDAAQAIRNLRNRGAIR